MHPHISRIIAYCAIALTAICNSVSAKEPDVSGSGAIHPSLVNKYYQLNNNAKVWVNASAVSADMRQRFLATLDTCQNMGLNKERYHYSALRATDIPTDTAEAGRRDRLFADAAIAFSKDLYQGAHISEWLINDEVSGKSAAADNDLVVSKLAAINSGAALSAYFISLEPTDKKYSKLRHELKKQIGEGNEKKTDQIAASMNLYRWIHHFHFNRYIVVNVPATRLNYYDQGESQLNMAVVVGKPSTPTPLMATWCNQIVKYPFWNVPAKIGLTELFPKFKKNPAALQKMNMQVLDYKDNPVDADAVDWNLYTSATFPYKFRQYTGCDNSLGVIKFNLTDPYDVYLHDTNFREAFKKESRFLSHGCIRVQKPIELGSALLNGNLDTEFLKACMKEEPPTYTKLDKPVPVFIVYMTVAANEDGDVTYFKDVYHLFK